MMRETEHSHKTFHRKKTVTVLFICLFLFTVLIGRLVYLMVFQSAYYMEKAKELLASMPEIDAIFIDADNRMHTLDE